MCQRRGMLGSAPASRAGFGAPTKLTLTGHLHPLGTKKVRDDEGVIASTRGACTPNSVPRLVVTSCDFDPRLIVAWKDRDGAVRVVHHVDSL